jgi:hypothetical protein
MTDLVPARPTIPSDGEINTIYRLADGLAKSGFFRDSRSATQAFAKLMFGRDLGLSATASMTGIHIVEGKPELSANVQAQMVRVYQGPAGERYDYKVLAHTDELCTIRFFRRFGDDGDWESLGEETFTIDDAKRAGLANRGPWKSYPRNMLFARAMSNGVAFNCPEVTGGIRVYHEGEISTVLNSTAEEIEPVTETFSYGDDELAHEIETLVAEANRREPDSYRPAKVALLLANATDEERQAFAVSLRERLDADAETAMTEAAESGAVLEPASVDD